MSKQRPRGALTREAVVNAALSLVDKQGVDKFTVRALARVVGAPPMSLYTHFANKEALLDLMYSEISRRIYADEENASWQAELLALSKRVLRTLGDHPRWIDLLSRSALPLVVPMRERVLRLMVEDGISAQAGFQGLAGVALTSIGLVLANLTMNGGRSKSVLASRFAKIRSALDKADATEEATTRLAMSKVGRFDFESQLEFTIRTLIVGLERKLQPR
jgi:AcrR family transcriptional regulator